MIKHPLVDLGNLIGRIQAVQSHLKLNNRLPSTFTNKQLIILKDAIKQDMAYGTLDEKTGKTILYALMHPKPTQAGGDNNEIISTIQEIIDSLHKRQDALNQRSKELNQREAEMPSCQQSIPDSQTKVEEGQRRIPSNLVDTSMKPVPMPNYQKEQQMRIVSPNGAIANVSSSQFRVEILWKEIRRMGMQPFDFEREWSKQSDLKGIAKKNLVLDSMKTLRNIIDSNDRTNARLRLQLDNSTNMMLDRMMKIMERFRTNQILNVAKLFLHPIDAYPVAPRVNLSDMNRRKRQFQNRAKSEVVYLLDLIIQDWNRTWADVQSDNALRNYRFVTELSPGKTMTNRYMNSPYRNTSIWGSILTPGNEMPNKPGSKLWVDWSDGDWYTLGHIMVGSIRVDSILERYPLETLSEDLRAFMERLL